MSLKALREKAGTLAAEIKRQADKINDESREFTAEEKVAWEKVNGDYDANAAQIKIAERADLVNKEVSAITHQEIVAGLNIRPEQAAIGSDGASLTITDEHRSLALNAWFRAQVHDEPTPEQVQACRLLSFNPNKPTLTMPLLDTRQYRSLQGRYTSKHPDQARHAVHDFKATLGTGSGAAGAYLIPPETLIRQLEINMLAFGGMRQVAESIRTSSGERMSWPTADDTTNTGVQLGESTTFGSSMDPSFGKVYWDAYKFSSKLILVPYELLQDSFIDLPTVLGDMLGERLGRITNTKFTTGTGASTCKGIVTAATAFSAASASAIAADDLFGLQHSIDPAYRNGAAWMMHDTILLALRKLKDGEGRYMWQAGLQDNRPDMLLGASITNNQDMDSTISSGKKTILYGQLSKYKIRTVGSVRMYRLQERYRDVDQDAFVAFTREDGNLLTAGTANVKYMSH